MTYQAVLKQNAKFTVPEALFNEKFPDFENGYSGEVNGHKVPAWRAFEIAYKQGKLEVKHGDSGRDNKKHRRSFKTRLKGDSDATDDGSGQVGAD